MMALGMAGAVFGAGCGTSGRARSAAGSHPDQPHHAKGVIVPSDVPMGSGPMGQSSTTGTTGATTGSDLGKGTVGSGAQ